MRGVSVAPLLSGKHLRLFLKQNGRCVYCNRRMIMAANPPKEWMHLRCTREHVVPRSKGGRALANNIVGACHHCNTTRGNRSLSEFIMGWRPPPTWPTPKPKPAPYRYTPCDVPF